jgi:hypothetical protein
MRGVELADVSPATGSLVIYHDPETIAAGELVAVLRARGLITRSVRRLSSRRRSVPKAAIASWLLRALLLAVAA